MKRILQYLMVFLIVFIASAGTMVVMYKVSSGSEHSGLYAGTDTDIEETSDPILDGLVSRVLSTNNVQVSLDISVLYKGTTIRVEGEAYVIVSPAVALDFEGQVTVGEGTYPVYVHYEEDKVYLSALGQNVTFTLSNMVEGLDPIITALQPYLSAIDLSFLKDFGIDIDHLEDFDVSSLTSLLSYLKTEEVESGYLVTLDIPDVLSASLMLDEEFAIKSVTLPMTNIAGVSVQANLTTTFDSDQFVLPSVQEKEYLDVTNVVDLVGMILGVSNQKTFNLAISANVFGYDIRGMLDIDISEDLRIQFIGNIAGFDVQLVYKEGKIFITFNGIKLLVTVEDLQSILSSIAPNLDLGAIDLSGLNIQSLISSIEKEDNLIIVTTKQWGTLTFEADESGKLSTIAYTYDTHQVNVQLTTNTKVEWIEPQGDYTTWNVVKSYIDNVLDIVKEKSISADFTITVSGMTFAGELVAHFGDNISLQVSTTVLGKDILLTYKDDIVYLDIDQVHMQASLDEILQFVSEEFGIELSSNIGFNSLDFNNLDIVRILQNLVLSTWNEKQLEIGYNSLHLVVERVEERLSDIHLTYGDQVELVLTLANKNMQPIDTNQYLPFSSVTPLITQVLDIIQSKKVEGKFSITFGEFEAQGTYLVDCSQISNLEDIKNIKAQVVTNLYGLDVKLTILNQTIYANVAGLGISVSFDEIPTLLQWVEEQFGLSIALDTSVLSDFTLSDSILFANEGVFAIEFGEGLTLSVDFGQGLQVNVVYGTLVANVDMCVSGEEITLTGQYEHYTLLTGIVDSVLTIMDKKQVNLTAKATVYEKESVRFDVSCGLAIDWASSLNLYGLATLTGEQDMEFSLAYEESMLYINYDKLKVKLSRTALLEVGYMLGELFGLDMSFLPVVGDMIQDDGLDMSNLQNILPNLDLSNPLAMLSYIKSLAYDGSDIVVTISGKILSNEENVPDLSIRILLDHGTLRGFALQDCYTGVTETERFDLLIELSSFEGVTKVTDKEAYIDLSDVSGLIKAVIQTSSLQYFHITATLDIKMQILSINDAITMNIPLDIAIRLKDNKPEIMATIGPIPVIAPVDNDVPYEFGDTVKGANPGKNRILKVYYADGYVYFYRSEDVPRFPTGSRTYEKMLKVTLDEFLSNPLMILSYGCGFQDIVMNEITKAVEKATNRDTPLDMSNILLGFGKTDNTYELVLNLAELANNTDLDTVTVSLTTSTISDKEYLTQGTLKVHMPIASGFVLDLNSTDITLQNIGEEIDFAHLEQFISTYPYKVDEKWHASKGQWTLDSATVYTVQFDSLGGVSVPSVTGAIDTVYELPNLPEKVVEEMESTTIYTFAGWYQSADCEGEAYTHNVITKGDLVLYAKWVEKEKYCTVYYVVDENRIDSYYALCGTPIKEIVLEDREVVDGRYRYTQTFDCWVDDMGDKITLIPRQNTTLYARFITLKTNTLWTVTYESEIGQTLESEEYYNDENIVLPTYHDVTINDDGTSTVYHFEGWYEDVEGTITPSSIMPNHDLTLYAKWSVVSRVRQRNLTIVDNKETVYNTLVEVGDLVSLPRDIKVDSMTKWYEDEDYQVSTNLPSYMPDRDLVLYIRNTYTYKVIYYALEGGKHTEHTLEKWLYQGENLDSIEQEDYEIDYYQNGVLSHRIFYTFMGYGYSDGVKAECMPNHDLIVSSIYLEVRKNWYTVSFDVSWVKPSAWIDKNSALQGKITCKSAPIKPNSILVLEGESIDLSQITAYCTYDYQCVWVTDTYHLRVVTWNTTGVNNVLVSKIQNSSYTTLTSLTVTGNVTLYATWGSDI